MNIKIKNRSCILLCIFSLFLSLGIFSSCSKDDFNDDSYFSNIHQSLTSTADVLYIDIVTNGEWNVKLVSDESQDVSWLHPDKVNGKGNYRLTVNIDANDGDARKAVLKIDETEEAIEIKQEEGKAIKDISFIRQEALNADEKVTTTKNWYIKGVVVSDNTNKNLPENTFAIQDKMIENSGISIQCENSYSFVLGDTLTIPVRDSEVIKQGTLTLKLSAQQMANIIKSDINNPATAIELDNTSDFKNYESMFVHINGVQPKTHIGELWSELSHDKVEMQFTNDLEKSFLVENKSYGDLHYVPSASGDMSGVVISDNDGNMLVSSLNFSMTNDRAGDIPTSAIGSHYTNIELMNSLPSETVLSVPYIYGDGSVHNLTFSLSGDVSQGLSVEAAKSITYNTSGKDGLILIPIKGTPSKEGDVIVSISENGNVLKNLKLTVLPIKSIEFVSCKVVGKQILKGNNIEGSFVQITYKNGYGRSINVSGTVSGNATGNITIPEKNIVLTGDQGTVDVALMGSSSECGEIDIALRADNMTIPSCSTTVKDPILAKWEVSSPDNNVEGGMDYIKLPYKTSDKGMVTNNPGYCSAKNSDGTQKDAVVDIYGGASQDEMVKGPLYHMANKIQAAGWIVGSSGWEFTIPVENFDNDEIEIVTNYNRAGPAPKKWIYYYKNTDGTFVKTDGVVYDHWATDNKPIKGLTIRIRIPLVITDGEMVIRLQAEEASGKTGVATNMSFGDILQINKIYPDLK